MKRSCLLFISGVIASAGISASAFATNPDSTEFSVEVKPYLNVALSNTDVHLPITPSSTGTFGSANLTASASTNSALGYALTVSYLDSGDNLNTDLISNTINVNDGTYPTIPTFTTNDELTSDTFSASTSEDHLNHWAISVDDTNHYKKAVQGATIATSDGPIADDTTTINLATKLDLRTTPGSYSVIMNFQVVANPDAPDDNPINQAMEDAGKDPEIIDGKSYYRMQDMTAEICSSIATPTAADNSDTPETQLIDIRDNKLYWVAKLKDGKCWMTQNLDFNIDSTKTYTSADTDLTQYNVGSYTSANGYSENNNVISWQPLRSTGSTFTDNTVSPYSVDVGDIYWDGTYESIGWAYPLPNGGGSDSPYFATTPYDYNGTHGHVGNYYNWTAAIASNDSNVNEVNTINDLSNSPQNSVCPANWRLPRVAAVTNGEPGNNDFYNIAYYYGNVTNSDSAIIAKPLWFVRGGYFLYGTVGSSGGSGYYWSSTGKSWSYSYSFYFSKTSFSPIMGDYGKDDGMSIRCIVR